jgi:hypothetical protein
MLAIITANARLQPPQSEYHGKLPEGVVYGIRISFHDMLSKPKSADSITVVPQLDVDTLAADSDSVKPHLLRLKTNAIGWALLNGNAAVEYTFNQHWAVNLAIYYGALDYFKSTVKFRTHSFMPEVRYYTDLNKGFFAGVHLGLAYWNFALGGSTRFQDHRGKSPAYGGGVTAGYITRLGKSKRWNMEFALGAGVYHLRYDKFVNRHNGAKFEQKHKTEVLVDNLAVSLSYTFEIIRKHAH